MENFKCYIIDDEPLAIKVIEQHLSKFDQFEVCGKTTEPIRALADLKTIQPDLLFLDIEMPEVNGLELLATIHDKPEIIITTAYREFAVEGFEMNVLDYLVKPIPFTRFMKAIGKFLDQKQRSVPLSQPRQPTPQFIFVKADRKTVKIDLESVLYVEGFKDYTRIVMPDQKIMTKVSIGNFFKELPQPRFIRVHKSYIVARDKITAYTAYDVEIGDREIPIGRTYKEQFLSQI